MDKLHDLFAPVEVDTTSDATCVKFVYNSKEGVVGVPPLEFNVSSKQLFAMLLALTKEKGHCPALLEARVVRAEEVSFQMAVGDEPWSGDENLPNLDD